MSKGGWTGFLRMQWRGSSEWWGGGRLPGEGREVKTSQAKKDSWHQTMVLCRAGTFHSTLGHSLWLRQRLHVWKEAGDEREARRETSGWIVKCLKLHAKTFGLWSYLQVLGSRGGLNPRITFSNSFLMLSLAAEVRLAKTPGKQPSLEAEVGVLTSMTKTP